MDHPKHISTAAVMTEIESDVRDRLRGRLLERGGAPEYRDAETFQAVERVLRRAVDDRDPEALLLPDLLSDEEDWRLQTHLRFSSHRPAAGKVIVFFKRRLLLPLTRWLYEYSLDNFRRQARVNQILFACIEELALENARLRRDLERLTDKT